MLSGDTKILTVYDGPVKLKDLEDGTLIYSLDPSTKLPVVRVVEDVGLKERDVPVMAVEFDSGLVIKCTYQHEFYRFRGTKEYAMFLVIGNSIRAFSVSLHKDGHLRVHGWSDGKAKHQYVARMVWECFHGPIEGKLILHHRDFNELNNRIENFELLTNSQHNSVHYPYRHKKGFYKRNHKVILTYPAGKEDVYGGSVDRTHTFIVADDKAVAGLYSGVVISD